MTIQLWIKNNVNYEDGKKGVKKINLHQSEQRIGSTHKWLWTEYFLPCSIVVYISRAIAFYKDIKIVLTKLSFFALWLSKLIKRYFVDKPLDQWGP